MRLSLLVIIFVTAISCGQSEKLDFARKDARQLQNRVDSLSKILKRQSQTIDSLESLSSQQQRKLSELKTYQLKNEESKKSQFYCDMDLVLAAEQSLDSLNESLVYGLLSTFNKGCSSNIEYAEASNKVLFSVMEKSPELLIKTIHENENSFNLDAILDELSAPLLDYDFEDIRSNIWDIYGYQSTKDTVLTSINKVVMANGRNVMSDEDCIFDMATQTDEFLKGIPELSPYKWNENRHTAKINLGKGETLFLNRGGCVHFNFQATFQLKEQEIFKDIAIEKSLWIGDLLVDEFIYFEKVKEELTNGTYPIEINDNSLTIGFSDQSLIDVHYAINMYQSDNHTTLVFGWYMN
ncbi:hypothetical protein [Roseivirga pacifica]|uniref:hypothetical protein n=1 Tax=Roseivirga pacifica TaxID=1267423 RepID=UPI003BB131CF